jgi:hypothetical protein
MSVDFPVTSKRRKKAEEDLFRESMGFDEEEAFQQAMGQERLGELAQSWADPIDQRMPLPTATPVPMAAPVPTAAAAPVAPRRPPRDPAEAQRLQQLGQTELEEMKKRERGFFVSRREPGESWFRPSGFTEYWSQPSPDLFTAESKLNIGPWAEIFKKSPLFETLGAALQGRTPGSPILGEVCC